MWYASWELNSSWEDFGPWFANNMWIPITLSVIYVFGVHYGQHLMKNKPAYDLKQVLVYWNGFLTLLSWALALRLTPPLIAALMKGGWTFSLCDNEYTKAPTGVWVAVFVCSKVPELLDTAFLVLRKKEVILLHWYHHWSVLMYSWNAYAHRVPTGLWFQSMNAIVHSFMYAYYTLTSMGYRPRWNMVLTLGQIVQMVMGVYISVNDLVNTHCGYRPNTIFGILMYFSYFLLFAKLFYDSYIAGKKRTGSKPPKELAGAAAGSTDAAAVASTKKSASNGASAGGGNSSNGSAGQAPVRQRSKKAE